MEALSTPALNLSAVRKETLLCLLVVFLVLTECPSTRQAVDSVLWGE